MRSYTSVSCSPYQRFSLFKFDVFACFEIFVSFCKPKIDDKECIFFIICASHEVIWFDIPMHKALHMQKFNSRDQLVSYH
jgi:hypothetical protein